MSNPNVTCPECRDGKHRNCDGTAWDFNDDRLVFCACWRRHHRDEP